MESPSQDRLLLIMRFFCKAYWATPFKMHFDFSSSPSQNFRKNTPIIQRPHPSAGGCIRGTANTRGLGVWLSQNLTFGSLAVGFGACFLRLQKVTLDNTSDKCKDVLQDHGIWLWRSLTFGSLAATYEGKGKCAVPFSCRTPGPWAAGGGSTEQAVMYTMIMIHNIQLSRNFRE